MKNGARRARAWAGLAAVLAMTTPALAGPASVEQILKLHVEARGGEARWRSLKGLELSGTQIAFSEPHPFKLTRSRPNLYRLEQTILGQPVVEVFDGSRAWWINGVMGNTWPLPAPEPQSTFIARDAPFLPPLIGRGEGGEKIVLKGLETFEGRQAYALEVTLRDGAKETWILDPRTYLEIARISRTTDFGQEMERRTYYSNFKSTGGLLIPRHLDIEYGTRNEVIDILQVATDPPIDAKLFELPPPEGMDALGSLAGEWTVELQTRLSPRHPWETRPAAATITPQLEGALLEEHLTYSDSGLPVEIYRTWSFDRFQKVYRIAQTDNYTFHLNVLEGTLVDGRLTAGNEKTGTTWKTPDGAIHARIIAHDLTPDRFQIDSESSIDGGKTWTTDQKLSYSRK